MYVDKLKARSTEWRISRTTQVVHTSAEGRDQYESQSIYSTWTLHGERVRSESLRSGEEHRAASCGESPQSMSWPLSGTVRWIPGRGSSRRVFGLGAGIVVGQRRASSTDSSPRLAFETKVRS